MHLLIFFILKILYHLKNIYYFVQKHLSIFLEETINEKSRVGKRNKSIRQTLFENILLNRSSIDNNFDTFVPVYDDHKKHFH